MTSGIRKDNCGKASRASEPSLHKLRNLHVEYVSVHLLGSAVIRKQNLKDGLRPKAVEVGLARLL